jgi:hypothetical protein
MELIQEIKSALIQMDFAGRYKTLSRDHQHDNGHFETFDVENVKQIIEKSGYSTKYHKSERFFKILEKHPPFQFQFNISLKSGAAELIWDIIKNNERSEIGGPWGLVTRTILNTEDRFKLPGFKSYGELEEILKEAFHIYEDFKKVILAPYQN